MKRFDLLVPAEAVLGTVDSLNPSTLLCEMTSDKL